jgi:hypothetical protein
VENEQLLGGQFHGTVVLKLWKPYQMSSDVVSVSQVQGQLKVWLPEVEC